jgi:hypothetical protein
VKKIVRAKRQLVMAVLVGLGIFSAEKSALPFSQNSPAITNIGHEFITVEGAKRQGLNTSGFGGAVDSSDTSSYDGVLSLNVLAAVIGERWVDLMGNAMSGDDMHACFYAVAQDPNQIMYDHFLRRLEDGGRMGAINAIDRSRIRFKQLFIEAALSENPIKNVLDGGGSSTVYQLPLAYVHFGRALHLLQDSFSAEHAVRAKDDDGKRILDILSYVPTPDSNYHFHPGTWDKDDPRWGDEIHDANGGIKAEPANAIKATQFAWKKFEEARAAKTLTAAQDAATAVIDEWMKFDPTHYTGVVQATDAEPHFPRNVKPVASEFVKYRDRCLLMMGAQIPECVPVSWASWDRPPYDYDDWFWTGDVTDEAWDASLYPPNKQPVACHSLGIAKPFRIVKNDLEYLSAQPIALDEGEVLALVLTRKGMVDPISDPKQGTLTGDAIGAQGWALQYKAPDSITTYQEVTIKATAENVDGQETARPVAAVKIALVPKLHFKEPCPSGIGNGASWKMAVRETVPVTWSISDYSGGDTLDPRDTPTDQGATLTGGSGVDLYNWEFSCQSRIKPGTTPRTVILRAVAADNREASCEIRVPGNVINSAPYPGPLFCGGKRAADIIKVKPGAVSQFFLRVGKNKIPLQLTTASGLPSEQIGGGSAKRATAEKGIASIMGARSAIGKGLAANATKAKNYQLQIAAIASMRSKSASSSVRANRLIVSKLNALEKLATKSIRELPQQTVVRAMLKKEIQTPNRIAAAAESSARLNATFVAPASAQSIELSGQTPFKNNLKISVQVAP